MECAAGCGSRADTGPQDGNLGLVPPIQWITIGLDVAQQEPPYQERDTSYSAVCCSLDCVITFLRRKHQGLVSSKMPHVIERSWDWTPETRSDVAKRIGFLILEAITEMQDDGPGIMLPLIQDRELLGRDVTLALISGIPEIDELTKEVDQSRLS